MKVLRVLSCVLSAAALLSCGDEEEVPCPDCDKPRCEQTEDCEVGFFCVDRNCEQRESYQEKGTIYVDGTYVALISDVTANESCGLDTAGADIVYVALENSVGDQRAWGRLIADLPGPPFDADSTLDGTAPDFNLDCPDFDSANFVSIGCDRSIAVEFIDANGELTQIQAGETLRVFEYGNQCGGDMIEENYRVYLCKDAYAIFDRDVRSCNAELSDSVPSTGDDSFVVDKLPN